MLAKAVTIDLRGLRLAGAAMLGAAAIWPLLPHDAGLPCPLRSLTGIPCPSCGMTTSVVAAAHGDLSAAFSANPFGLLAIVVAVLLLLRPRTRSLSVPLAVIATCGVASWLFQLHRFGYLN